MVVRCVVPSPDGKTFLSCSDDQTLKGWDSVTGAEVQTLKGHATSVLCCAYSKDGSKIASGSYDKVVKVWNAQSGAEISTLVSRIELGPSSIVLFFVV